jgi:glycosyltransferase involved in cell wall biosynthesis
MEAAFLKGIPCIETADAEKLVQSPVASVLMITYNHERFIDKAIEGVVTQHAAFPYELIIGEDCSKDRTRQIALDYQKRYPDKIKVLTADRNVGPKRNSFRNLNAARGKYIAYCEGDDYWHEPRKLQKQVEFLEKNPDYGLVHSCFHTHYVKGDRLIRNDYVPDHEFDDAGAFREIILNRRRLVTATVMCRKDLLVRVIEENPECTDDAWPMGDTQRWLEIARLSKLKYLPDSLATHNILEESVSQSQDPAKVYRFRVRARDLILHYVAKYKLGTEVEREARAITARCLMANAYFARQRQVMPGLLQDAVGCSTPLPAENWLHYYGCKNEPLFYLAGAGLLGLRAIHRFHRTLSQLAHRIGPGLSQKPAPHRTKMKTA